MLKKYLKKNNYFKFINSPKKKRYRNNILFSFGYDKLNNMVIGPMSTHGGVKSVDKAEVNPNASELSLDICSIVYDWVNKHSGLKVIEYPEFKGFWRHIHIKETQNNEFIVIFRFNDYEKWELEWKLERGKFIKYLKSTSYKLGYNLKATDMQAAIGISQLNKLESFIKTRRENFSYLYNEFKNFKEFDLPVWYKDTNPSWFGFPLMLNDNAKFTREDLLRFYQERKIGTRLIFAGNITKQPAYINSNISENKEFPIADQIMNNAFWLGVYPGLNLEMLDFIIDETKIFLNNKKR